MRRVAGVLFVAVLLLATRAAADELLVFAAASLADVLRELGAAYEKTGHDTVAFNFGASNALARQIQAGAPADVFLSADAAQMDELERAGLVARGDRRDLLSNVLVVVVPAGTTTTISAPADLKKVHRLALANPEGVPAGVYAKTYLQSLDLWGSLADKVVPTLDVRAALAAVESEEADAAIVYATDAAVSKKVRTAFRVPREHGPRILYTLAPLARSTKPGTRGLVRFLASRDAAKVYERYGFIVVSAE
jgi:molybdate transport system substrate-binding protein